MNILKMWSVDSRDRRIATMKVIVLVLLCLQNSGYALLRRYSQGILLQKATPSSILLVGEIIKLLYSALRIFASPGASSAPLGETLPHKALYIVSTSRPMLVPAGVYLIMNLLSYASLQRIDAGLFTVFSQGKLLTTGVFSVLMLNRSLHVRKWRALMLSVLGTILISHQTMPIIELGQQKRTEFLVGIAAVVSEVVLSGFVSVYFEKVLKAKINMEITPTVWDRNIQLAFFSILIYYPRAIRDAQGEGLFNGWTSLTLLVSVVGAAGGILVALCVKYTDAIVK
eukprot:Ihof_evm6s179 gene=Ihof_evmTU6s179